MSGKTKILALLLLGLGMIFLVLAFLSGQNVKKNGDTLKNELERYPVVVSTKEIPFGQIITGDLLKVEKFAIAPAGSYKDINEVIGKKPVFNIGPGLPITAQYFESGAVAAEVRDGFRAFALRLDENNVATGKIKPGDFVDVFSIFRANNQDVEQTVSRLILPKLRVLSVGQQLVNAPEAAAKDDKDPNGQRRQNQRAMMVEVAVPDINALAIAQSQGELFVVLRGPDDEEMPDPSKYPLAENVLKPIQPKAEKGQPAPPPVELNSSDKAYAGLSLSNAVLPGSGNGKNNAKKPATNSTGNARPAEDSGSAVEVIRGGETSREKAR
ncbi:MAG TPA: Flp pilus assembly protein CpaB [Limnobacter sp.]|uniref:Flp pilus assembly protein CpaB n=1 Tax=Limnobacter sp. TaxID=2003368 RepID=UPI002ED99B2C